jgi:hypothetical protein
MRLSMTGLALLTLLCLSGCNRAQGALDDQGRHGRYAGVGIYSPDKQWAKVSAAAQPTGPAAAAVDDQVIIVVVNSDTGELRACGDLSGYCIGMNPWDKPLPPSGHTPIALTSHVIPQAAPDAASTQ